MKTAWKVSIALIILLGAGWTTTIVLAQWFTPPDNVIVCLDGGKVVVQEDTSFRACLEKEARLFLEKDYAESKDLAKTFLTLISATLVASITFSEKIVDVGKAEVLSLSTMIVCWVLLLVALVACGGGLAIMTTVAGMAAYQPELDYRHLETRGINLFLCSGVAFVFALMALIVAGIASLVEKRAAARV